MVISFIGLIPHGMMNASAPETGPGFHSACGSITEYARSRRHNPSAEWTETTVHEWLAQDHNANCHSRELKHGLSSECPTHCRLSYVHCTEEIWEMESIQLLYFWDETSPLLDEAWWPSGLVGWFQIRRQPARVRTQS